MNDLESPNISFNCIICLDNDIKKTKKYCLYHHDKIKKINCECNVYCHSTCIKENIFKYNDGIQECIICKKIYNPLYKNTIDFSCIERCIIGFYSIIIFFYNIVMVFLFFIFFVLISGYISQLFNYLFSHEYIYNPFNPYFVFGGLLTFMVLFICLTKCNPDNIDNIYVKIFDKYSKLFHLY